MSAIHFFDAKIVFFRSAIETTQIKWWLKWFNGTFKDTTKPRQHHLEFSYLRTWTWRKCIHSTMLQTLNVWVKTLRVSPWAISVVLGGNKELASHFSIFYFFGIVVTTVTATSEPRMKYCITNGFRYLFKLCGNSCIFYSCKWENSRLLSAVIST